MIYLFSTSDSCIEEALEGPDNFDVDKAIKKFKDLLEIDGTPSWLGYSSADPVENEKEYAEHLAKSKEHHKRWNENKEMILSRFKASSIEDAILQYLINIHEFKKVKFEEVRW